MTQPVYPPWNLDARHTALLIIDMQNDFLKPGGVLTRSELPLRAVEPIRRLRSVCRALSVPVVYVQTLLSDTFPLSPLEALYHPGAGLEKAGMRPGTWGAQIIDELTPAEDEPVVVKHRYDAFYNTSLETVLRNIRGACGVDTLIITGTVTNVCCESTARSAFMRDFKVAFPHDANGPLDEASHQATLRTIAGFFGRVLSSGQIIDELRRSLDQREGV